MNPKKWFDLQNGGKLTDTRETINGFPCRLILINDGSTPLQEGQEEPTPGNTKDMGVFNFNNDKSNTKTLGFDIENFPYCASFEVASNSDTSAGAFMSYNVYKMKANYNQLENSTYLQALDPNFFNYEKIVTDNLHSIQCFRLDGTTDYVFNGNYPAMGKDIIKIIIRLSGNILESSPTITINNKTFILEPTDRNIRDLENPILNSEGELEYIKNSFELRFPDEDDVGADYGFLDVNGDTTRGLKRVIDFVDKSSDEDFVAHFEEYFNKQYTFRYYLLVMGLG